ncbi:AraC family transcriptional regulator [Asanoa ishikariensis]|nr:AraC family transcriptional regulator [Asanoa ishikariensis]
MRWAPADGPTTMVDHAVPECDDLQVVRPLPLVRFSTADVPKDVRFATWHEMTATALISTTVVADDIDDFAAVVELLDLGRVQLSKISYPPLRAERSSRHIRRSDPGWFYLTVPTGGPLAINHADRQCTVGPGQFAMVDTSLPGVVANRRPVQQLIIHVLRSDLPLRHAQMRPGLARAFPLGGGLGALLVGTAAQIMESADQYSPHDARALAQVLVDLLVSVLAQFDAGVGAASDAQHRLLHLKALDFIEKHLADPGLTPEGVAAAQSVSLRYLQMLFREQGSTIAGLIRQRRLERCRRELREDTFRRRSVAAIGARWGFGDATAFSRAFKQAFGTPPGEYRQRKCARTVNGSARIANPLPHKLVHHRPGKDPTQDLRSSQ